MLKLVSIYRYMMDHTAILQGDYKCVEREDICRERSSLKVEIGISILRSHSTSFVSVTRRYAQKKRRRSPPIALEVLVYHGYDKRVPTPMV